MMLETIYAFIGCSIALSAQSWIAPKLVVLGQAIVAVF